MSNHTGQDYKFIRCHSLGRRINQKKCLIHCTAAVSVLGGGFSVLEVKKEQREIVAVQPLMIQMIKPYLLIWKLTFFPFEDKKTRAASRAPVQSCTISTFSHYWICSTTRLWGQILYIDYICWRGTGALQLGSRRWECVYRACIWKGAKNNSQ